MNNHCHSFIFASVKVSLKPLYFMFDRFLDKPLIGFMVDRDDWKEVFTIPENVRSS